MLQRPRASHRDGQRHLRDSDYSHLVTALKRHPGAFARLVLRGAVFPRAVNRLTWERLAAALPKRQGVQDDRRAARAGRRRPRGATRRRTRS